MKVKYINGILTVELFTLKHATTYCTKLISLQFYIHEYSLFQQKLVNHVDLLESPTLCDDKLRFSLF